jgi:hypothetical protein
MMTNNKASKPRNLNYQDVMTCMHVDGILEDDYFIALVEAIMQEGCRSEKDMVLRSQLVDRYACQLTAYVNGAIRGSGMCLQCSFRRTRHS